MLSRRALSAVIIFAISNPVLVLAQDRPVKPKERTFRLTYAATIKDIPAGQKVRVWTPVPAESDFQSVAVVAEKYPASNEFHRDATYGNKMVYFEASPDSKGEISYEATYQITRKEVTTNKKKAAPLKATEPLKRYLQPDALVPVQGKPAELIKDLVIQGDQTATAKSLYDFVFGRMKYDKTGKGWGRGDAAWACDSKVGNCTDFHSVFISMARSKGIPAKFEMGFAIPAKHGEGVIGGYHCWAWFLPEKLGWMPVDISEASLSPDRKDYLFGNLTEDRVQFTTGRDIQLSPPQAGPALNFFIYPYAEANGRTVPSDQIVRRFTYKDVP